MAYRLLADLVLLVHAGFVAFVVFSLPLILIGAWRRWPWVRNRWFRGAHLLCILIVVGQAWGGIICPLTRWENELRWRGGDTTYATGFIAHWVHTCLFFEAEPWVFTMIYSIFGALVVATIVLVRPTSHGRRRPRRGSYGVEGEP